MAVIKKDEDQFLVFFYFLRRVDISTMKMIKKSARL